MGNVILSKLQTLTKLSQNGSANIQKGPKNRPAKNDGKQNGNGKGHHTVKDCIAQSTRGKIEKGI